MNELTDRLSTLADEMTGTDYVGLRDRVYMTSRRIRRRRTVLASLTGVAVVAVLAGGIIFASDGGRAPDLSGDVSPGPTSASASTAATPTEPVGRTLPGTLVYLKALPNRPVEVITVTNTTGRIDAGTKRSTTFGTAQIEPFDGAVAVSPDHGKVAVVESPAGGQVGDLVVMEPGGARRTLASNVFWGGGVWPVWTPDSTAVIVRIDGTWTRVDLTSRATTPFTGVSADSKSLTWSTDARWLAYDSGSKTITVSRPDGTGKRQASVAGLPDCQKTTACPTSVQAVSNDGRYVALGHGNPGPGAVNESHLVLDMQTGQPVSLPSVIREVVNVYFLPDRGMVIRGFDVVGEEYDDRSANLYVVDADRNLIGTLRDPVKGGGIDEVGYRP